MVVNNLSDGRPRAASTAESAYIEGPVGRIALLLDQTSRPGVGVAVIAHPQPLMGGSPRHKIPHRLAQATVGLGWQVYRPSFRGVGGSEGQYDHGVGETEDMLAVVAHARQQHPGLPLALIGFSFGAYVMSRVASRLVGAGCEAKKVILLGLPVGDVPGGRNYDTEQVPATTLVVHGENDNNAYLAQLMDWARPQRLPVVVVPGADHFFSDSLDRLIALVVRELGC